MTRWSRALQTVTGADHVYAAVIGHHIPHFHLHLIPRYPGTPRVLVDARGRVAGRAARRRGRDRDHAAFEQAGRARHDREDGVCLSSSRRGILVVSGVRPDRFASLCDARDGRIVQPSHEL